MLADVVARRLTVAWQNQVAQHAANVAAITTDLFLGLDAWNIENVADFAQATLDLHVAAKATSVTSTSAYLSLLTGVPVEGIDVDLVPARIPDPREPFTAMWRAMKDGAAFDDALGVGSSTAGEGITSHVFRASRQTGDVWAAQAGQQVVGWRRVPTGSSCEWCGLVATQRYKSSESADFGHNNCDCATIPIIGDRDPGRFINQDLAANIDPRTSERIDQNRRVADKTRAADNAINRRNQALTELRAETDPERRARLEGRARKWDNKAAHYRAQAANNTIPTIPSPPTRTGYVDEFGNPAPRPDRVPTA